jgi:serine/threonine-protein kinase
MPPPDQLTAALTGRYEVEREIGAGGMATVYLARDVKHNRRVALKVLKPELGAVLGVERFLSEIQVTANLQHPNLLPLFDSGEANGLLFYVMPFVDGESLRARLDREKQLPVDEAVRIAVAIAGALDYAHANGVIHRDMKPENVLLQAGQPVIADFGIALAVSNAGGARVTQTGLSLGTPQYMSPEQATGDRVIDGRTDIYSLAAMTYEMLTGEPPHTGTSAQAIIAKLMTEDVRPLTVLRRAVPPHVDAAVRHGLEKLAADRFATAGDFSLALTGARPFTMTGTATSANAASFAATARSRMLMRVAVAALAVVALAGVSAAYWFATRPAPRSPAVRFLFGFPDSVTLFAGGGTKMAFSKDGTKLVFVGVKNGLKSLYVRRMEDPIAQQVRGVDPAVGSLNVSPAFSPDGEWIVYEAEGVLKKIPVAGGTAQTVSDSGAGGSWGDHNTLVFAHRTSLWLGTSEGRDARVLAKPDSTQHVYGLNWPDVLPGAEDALVTLNHAPSNGLIVDSMRLGVVSLKTGAITDLGLYGTNAHYVRSGHIVFGRAGGLVFVAPYSLRKRAVTGPATLLLEGIWQGSGGATGFTVSDNGALAYHEGSQAAGRSLVIVDRSGAAQQIPAEEVNYQYPRVSPDGRRIVTEVRTSSGRIGVSLVDIGTGARERLAADDSGRGPEWTRDGARVIFSRPLGGGNGSELVSRAPDRSSPDAVLRRETLNGRTSITPVLGPAHGFAAVTQVIDGRVGVYVSPPDSIGVRRPFAVGSTRQYSPSISADGRLLAWVSDESGPLQVYAQPIAGGGRLRVSVNGGTEPVWSRTGSTLFYRGTTHFMSAEIGGPPLRVTRRDSLFQDSYVRARSFVQQWDVFPNGKEFLMVNERSTNSGAYVVLNWPQLKVAPGGGEQAR